MKTRHSPRQKTVSFFDLTGRVAIITGGAGLLGVQHAIAIHGFGGIPVLADIDSQAARAAVTGKLSLRPLEPVDKLEDVQAIARAVEDEV